jgi:hypothetical protein
MELGYLLHKEACDLLVLGNLEGASAIAETEIKRIGDRGNAAELWRFRLLEQKFWNFGGGSTRPSNICALLICQIPKTSSHP